MDHIGWMLYLTVTNTPQLKAKKDNEERGDFGVRKIHHDGMKVPIKWQNYLTIGDNEINLSNYLWSYDKSPEAKSMLQKNECIVYGGVPQPVMVTYCGVTPQEHLGSNHEEAVTMLLLHLNSQLKVR